jgi:transposase
MEACGSAHHWARELTVLGHEVRLIPPQYVKPYLRRGKNDRNDAEAICEAAGRPGAITPGHWEMRAVPASQDVINLQRPVTLTPQSAINWLIARLRQDRFGASSNAMERRQDLTPWLTHRWTGTKTGRQ